MKILLLALTILFPQLVHSQSITTIAGTGLWGYTGDGGMATAAEIRTPFDIAVDASGNIYFSDQGNFCIRKVTSSGIISTIAGTGLQGFSGDGGPATAAAMKATFGIVLDAVGNIYFSDRNNHRIRKITPAGIITTFAGNGTAGYSGDFGPATLAKLNAPEGLAIDKHGNIFISDDQNSVIRKVTKSGIITTVAGNGIAGYSGDGGLAVNASFFHQSGVAVDSAGNIFIADFNNHVVRKVDTFGVVQTIAGKGIPGNTGDGGPGTAAYLNYPADVAVDVRGNVYVADRNNQEIRKIYPSGIIVTSAGSLGPGGYGGDNGPATAARINNAPGIGLNAAGDIYIADALNSRIRMVIDSNNYNPFFYYGHSKTINVCTGQNANIDTTLKVMDFSVGKIDSWSMFLAPTHGTLNSSYAATSNSGYLIPTGLFYAPSSGYTGNDSFGIAVTNGITSDSIYVFAIVSQCTNAISNAAKRSTQILLFPNPAKTKLTVISPDLIEHVVITSSQGKTVCSHHYQSHEIEIDISSFPSGLYFIKVNGSDVRRFIKLED